MKAESVRFSGDEEILREVRPTFKEES